MSEMIVLLLVLPLLVLVLVFGTVVTIALFQARPEDIPAVLRECNAVFRRLADRVPTVRSNDLLHRSKLSTQVNEEQGEALP